MNNFESNCKEIYDKYVKVYLSQKTKTDSALKDMADNMRLLAQLSEQMADEITDIANQELKNNKIDKETIIQIAQKYLKQFTIDIVKGNY